MNPLTLARWLHILAAGAWLGEVVTVVFVLVPAAMRLRGKARAAYLAETFPRVFRLASALAVLTLGAGAWLNYLMTGWRDLDTFFLSSRGLPIAAGGALGLLLAAFHFIVEGRLEARVQSLNERLDEDRLGAYSVFLKRVPAVGLVVMLAIFLLMMIGARGV